jgi:hypothetical protein
VEARPSFLPLSDCVWQRQEYGRELPKTSAHTRQMSFFRHSDSESLLVYGNSLSIKGEAEKGGKK